ncbi:unnamed protein product [Vicia faba]|uniref:Uncharacterized protein n=1 Tax=Vicia faba TaxID=3906 RepID=A0AAV0YKE6_VICFA|nr:unnamed protein product [Vicia faba]
MLTNWYRGFFSFFCRNMKRTKQSHPHNIGHLSMIHSRRRLHHLRRQHLEATTRTTEAPAAPYLHRLHAYRPPCRSTSFGLPHIAIATPADLAARHHEQPANALLNV